MRCGKNLTPLEYGNHQIYLMGSTKKDKEEICKSI